MNHGGHGRLRLGRDGGTGNSGSVRKAQALGRLATDGHDDREGAEARHRGISSLRRCGSWLVDACDLAIEE